MGTIAITCPHCDTEKVGFNVVRGVQHGGNSKWYFALAVCGHCHEAIVMKYGQVAPGPNPSDHAGDLSKARHLQLINYWPRVEKAVAPADTPPRPAAAYLEALDSLRRRNWNSAGMMFRRALELATQSIDPTLAGKKLAARIDALAERNLVTPAMREWAHIVRLDGNAAVHDNEDIDESMASGLQNFTEMFFLYAFTLPAMVAERSKPMAVAESGKRES